MRSPREVLQGEPTASAPRIFRWVTDNQPKTIPIACSLTGSGLVRQRERYATIGRTAISSRRSARELEVELSGDTNPSLVHEALVVERQCCPFFSLAFSETDRRLRVSVGNDQHVPALDTVAEALGLDEPGA